MQSTKQLEELVDELKLDNQGINYYEWKSEVQQVTRGIPYKNFTLKFIYEIGISYMK
jgi:hypothetical protein